MNKKCKNFRGDDGCQWCELGHVDCNECEEVSIYPFNLVDDANEDIKKYGKEIQIVRHEDEPQYYSVRILDIDEEGNSTLDLEYADNFFEDELADCVNDAWANVREKENIKEDNDAVISFRKVDNDLVNIIFFELDVSLYFYDHNDGSVCFVDDIEFFDDTNGDYCVYEVDYERTMRMVKEHQENAG